MPPENGQSKIEIRHVAIHEAGHTVARIRLGLGIHKTTIEPDEVSHGAAFGEEAWGGQAASEKQVMVACAGYAACISAGFDETTATYGCEQDFAEAAELIEYWQSAPLSVWQHRTVDLMRKPENVHAVKLLSDVLMQHGAIGSEHSQVLVELVDGEILETDWLNFVAQYPIQDGDPYSRPA